MDWCKLQPCCFVDEIPQTSCRRLKTMFPSRVCDMYLHGCKCTSSLSWQLFKNKAMELGEKLLPAFNTPTGIPRGVINLGRWVLAPALASSRPPVSESRQCHVIDSIYQHEVDSQIVLYFPVEFSLRDFSSMKMGFVTGSACLGWMW